MRSGRPFIDLVVAATLASTWLAAVVVAQAPRSQAKNAAPEGHPRDRVTPIWTDHLKVTTYPEATAVAPGERTSLVIEIQPGDGMHVYAPGAEGYRVIALAVSPQPFVRVVPLQYPASETYFFAPLNERVPVYQKPFTLRQELVLEDRPEARAAFRGKSSLSVAGTLSYQACDDKICFNPVTVPLSWALPLESAAGR
jgi:hypothetical protein